MRAKHRRPHQWQCKADGGGRSVEAFASLAIIGEPDANRSSGGRRGEP